ncbi:HAD family hydrolase [Naasia lichenicola]|uniref:HAD-IB family hydrolase n=1 Tax=Naasia lichenicola TaxID=2565933 RepID=A0A4S4FLU4_9MICO|nr:HAD-IB family hydrolase [Naasia lichenicola]THG31064.1 HAD-IB family hydrolase [Naasia lichenicola]
MSTPIAAFFDVDNTLLRGASLFHLGKGARRRGIVTLPMLARFAVKAASFMLVGENRHHLEQVRIQALEVIKGQTRADLRGLAEEIYEKYLARAIWPETLGLAHDHISKGHQVWLVTSTPDFLANVIAERLGLTGAMGTPLETEDDVYTGQLSGPLMHGSGKADAVALTASHIGAPLGECWAYSDSANDIPLLTLCGNRIAVNPDRTLRRHAVASGWSIMDLTVASIREARRRVRREGRQARRTPGRP